jgi:hypothetical protein
MLETAGVCLDFYAALIVINLPWNCSQLKRRLTMFFSIELISAYLPAKPPPF